MNADPYRVLGIQPGATPDEIKAAYRRAARRWHPDRNPSPQAAEMFRGIVAAYIALTRPEKAATPRSPGGFTPPAPAPPHHGPPSSGGFTPPYPPQQTRSDAQAAADLAALREALRGALDIPAHLDPLEVVGHAFVELWFATRLPRRNRRRRTAFEKFLDFLAEG